MFAPVQLRDPDPRAINGVSGVYTALGKMGTLSPHFHPDTGDLVFSFSTDPDANLALGVANAEGIMQLSIVTLGEKPRVIYSARSVLNNDGSERDVNKASEEQLRILSDRFDDGAGIMETFVITIEPNGDLVYQFVTGVKREKASGVIKR